MRKSFDSVWDAIEDDPAQRENMKVRSALMTVLTDFIVAEGMMQAQAAKKFGVTQPRISDLMRGKIDLFAIDTLVNMIGAAGLHVKIQIGKAA
jgi:predicted XRE-type DNA-binding protein